MGDQQQVPRETGAWSHQLGPGLRSLVVSVLQEAAGPWAGSVHTDLGRPAWVEAHRSPNDWSWGHWQRKTQGAKDEEGPGAGGTWAEQPGSDGWGAGVKVRCEGGRGRTQGGGPGASSVTPMDLGSQWGHSVGPGRLRSFPASVLLHCSGSRAGWPDNTLPGEGALLPGSLCKGPPQKASVQGPARRPPFLALPGTLTPPPFPESTCPWLRQL